MTYLLHKKGVLIYVFLMDEKVFFYSFRLKGEVASKVKAVGLSSGPLLANNRYITQV